MTIKYDIKLIQYLVTGALVVHFHETKRQLDSAAFYEQLSDTTEKVQQYLNGERALNASFHDFQYKTALEIEKLLEPHTSMLRLREIVSMEPLAGPAPPHSTEPREYSISVSRIGLSARASNALFVDNIRTVGDVVKIGQTELLKLPNLGRTTLKEIMEAFKKLGIEIPK